MAVSIAERIQHRHVAFRTHFVGEKQAAQQQGQGVTEGGLQKIYSDLKINTMKTHFSYFLFFIRNRKAKAISLCFTLFHGFHCSWPCPQGIRAKPSNGDTSAETD